jgi:hypothetical protein
MIKSIFHLFHRFQKRPKVRIPRYPISPYSPVKGIIPRTTKTALAFRLPSSIELFLKLSKSGNSPTGCPIFGITDPDIPGEPFKEDW